MLLYLIFIGAAVAAGLWIRQGVRRDRFQSAVENLVDRQAEEAAGPLLVFIQDRVPNGLVREWRFYIRYFAFRLAWANVWACVDKFKVIAPRKLPWEDYARKKVRSFFLEPPSELAILKLEKELDDKLAFYLNRVVQTGGGFAVQNCRSDIAAILKQRLFEPEGDPETLGPNFEEILGETIEVTGSRIEQEVKTNPAFRKKNK